MAPSALSRTVCLAPLRVSNNPNQEETVIRENETRRGRGRFLILFRSRVFKLACGASTQVHPRANRITTPQRVMVPPPRSQRAGR
jgi:hypothetical protein